MRKLFGLIAGAGLAVGIAGSANAAVLSLSNASLSLQIAALPGIAVAWNGTGSADVTATSISALTASIFSVSNLNTPVTDPSAFPITAVFIPSASNGVGSFTFNGSGVGGGTMALNGQSNVGLFGPPPAANLVVPFTSGGNGIGLGGAPIAASGLGISITVSGNGWTTGTASIGTVSKTGVAFNGSSVTLVTPTLISTNLGASPVIPSFATLTLQFVPEPGTALLLGAGVAGLAMLGRKRMSK
jgi:hypothetical protein